MLASVAVGLLLAEPLAQRLDIPTWHATGLASCVVGFLALTLSPGWLGTGFGGGATGRVCGLALTITPTGVLAVTHQWLNALVLLPLGVGVAWLPARWRRAATAGAVLLSPLVEFVQAVVPALGRTCTLDDVVLNVGGLLVGLALGVATAAVVPVLRRTGDAGS